MEGKKGLKEALLTAATALISYFTLSVLSTSLSVLCFGSPFMEIKKFPGLKKKGKDIPIPINID